MTVLRKSKCGWCHELYTWYDRFLDSKFAEEWLWRRWYGKYYLKSTVWWGRTISNQWHRRFH